MTSAMMEKTGATAREEKDWTHTRWMMYQLLSDFMIYRPSVHLVMKWRSKLSRTEWACEALDRFKAIIAEPDTHSLASFCKQETHEYDRLLERRQAAIPLREALYTDCEAELSAVRASAEYDRAGVILNKTAGEKDDELSVELEFMTVLAERLTEQGVRSQTECEALIRTQLGFVKRHMSVWVPPFCAQLRQHTDSPLYLALCDLMEEVLTFDHAWLNKQVVQ
ncbi:hypothetical protein B9G55_09695 [Saccharibacillus sp. O16]|nr:hypothetical protein B9G55_09695 [Saccharibacillus sp. O16]